MKLSNQSSLDKMPPDLYLAQQLAYGPSGFTASNVKKEEESTDYGAFEFDLNGQHCKFRTGKITPKKVGFFSTIWKRSKANQIVPYDFADPVDLFIFSVRTLKYFGQFIFPKVILYEKGFISNKEKGGKRAIRIYPPWIVTTNRQAKNTQTWQANYFLEIPTNKAIESIKVHKLLTQNT